MTASGPFASTIPFVPRGEREGETVTWFWIGSHNDFDKLFG